MSLRLPPWLRPSPPDVAIEIAARRITVAEISGAGAAPTVMACASEALPADVVAPALTGVNVPKIDVAAAAVRRAFEKAGVKMPKRAALVLPDSAARVAMLTFEQLPPKVEDRDQLVRWQLKKALPFPVEEAQVSYAMAGHDASGTTLAAVVIHREVLAQYEAVMSVLGIHAGIVDLASLNVFNGIIGAGVAPAGDWLLVCLAAESTTLAIARGAQLMFYRHRTSAEQEPISALVHQVAMYHEDRLGGTRFDKVWLCGAALAEAGGGERVRQEISTRLGVNAEAVDLRKAAALRDRITAAPEVLDALAAPVGLLLRERRVA